MAVITNQSDGGLLLRRLLIGAIAAPLILGWLILLGIKAGEYSTAFAISLFTLVIIVIFALLIWVTAAAMQGLTKERDRTVQALHLQEAKLRSFVEANIIGIISADLYGGIYEANDKFLDMIGYTREDFVTGKVNWKNITPPEYTELEIEIINQAKITGSCLPYEKKYIHRDGHLVPVVVGFSLVGEEQNEAIAFILDLSDRQQAETALRESEARFRLAFNNIPDVFVIYDAQRRFQFVNNSAIERIQKPSSAIIGCTDEEILPPEVTNVYLPTLIQATQTATPQTLETQFPVGNDTSHLLIKYVPILNEQGKMSQILGFAEDITAQKRVEATLRNQQKWLEYILNLMPLAFLLIEPETAKVTFANRTADILAGGEFPKGKPGDEYHTIYYCTDENGDRIPNAQMPGVRVAKGERLEGVEMDWHTPTGIRSLLIYADTLPTMHGYPATCVLVFQDISNLKNVEKALSLGYKRLHLLFDTANELLTSQDPVVLVENVFSKLAEQIRLDVYFNYLVEENGTILKLASYRGISEAVAETIQWLEFGQATCGVVAQERRPMGLQKVQERTDNTTEFIRSVGIQAYYCCPLIAQGKLLGTLGFGSCCRSQFTQNEIGMMQAVCDQVATALERASLIADLQAQTEQLREANRMKDEFLAILSHELRSPLNAILGWAQLLRSRKLSEVQITKAIETIERNAKAQTQLIEDLLDISRMIRGQLQLNVKNCDLMRIIEAALDTVNLAAQAKDIHLITRLDPRATMITGDSDRLQQVIWNLLSNAIKFTPQGGNVTIELTVTSPESSAKSRPHLAQLRVIDTGIGITAEFLPYVFDRFRQADSSSTRSHGGLGLGLAIVRHLVEMHGGTVHVASPGKDLGSIFTIYLPLVKTVNPPISTDVSAPENLLPNSLRGIRVLVVDDEADSREFLTTVLEQSEAEVETASSVAQALEIIRQSLPDVIVSDIGMPMEDGYSFIRKLRSLPPEAGGKIPATALTAYARAEDRRQALQAGFQLHLPKPIDPSELITVVASLAKRPASF
ncbi:ATPase [Calothrix sp. 336/3]|nr:ATPase [Calothrix sp. 336/3]